MKELLKLWKRNWRMAESRLLFLALLISVTAVSSVSFFTDRTSQAMDRQASQVLGGDLVVQSTRPISGEYLQQAEEMGIRTARIISFPSMIVANDKSQLVQLKAASSTYPLFGELQIADRLNALGQVEAFTTLDTASAWAEAHLYISLGIQPGEKVQLGQRQVKLSGVIAKSPDQGAAVFQFMPQVLIPLEALPATGLLTPASRARFSLLFAGEPGQIQELRNWLKPRLQKAEKIRSLDDGLPSIQQALQRGQRFLSLASLLSVILAGVAIALTSFSLSQRETTTVAVLKTLGASRRQIFLRYLGQLFLLASVAAFLGIVLGYVIQFVLAYLLRDFIGQTLPQPGFTPVLSGLLTAWIMVLGFSLPQLLRLVKVSPVAIFQRAHGKISGSMVATITGITLGLLLLIWLQVQDVKLSLVLLPALIAVMLCFWLVSVLLLRLLRWLHQYLSQRVLHLPKANSRIALLVMVFGVGFFSLLLLTALRTDLINRWQATLPENAPNYFLINIQPDEVDSVRQFFKQQNRDVEATLYPMIRGRLTEINHKPVSMDDFDNQRARGLLDREANLSMTAELPETNSIIAGQWFEAGASKGLSVEEGIAQTLNLKLGDVLTFDIAGEPFSEPITSLRTVRWDSMQPNFFIITAPGSIADKPHTFMTSLYVDEQNKPIIPKLIDLHPSVSAIDVSSILQKIRELINKAAFAVQTIFVFTLIAGIAVLFAALQSQRAERMQEIAILKSVGAGHSYLRKMIASEFVLIGVIAGFMAAVFAMLASNALAYKLFELSPEINLFLLLMGVLAGGILVGVGGYLNMRPLLKVTPMSLLKR